MDQGRDEKSPNPIDVHVGQRVRHRRKQLGVSQESLANKLQLTFQQVQKYERGSNRISASKLFEIAVALNTPVSWFFDNLTPAAPGEDGLRETPAPFVHDALLTPDASDMIAAFNKVRRKRMRRRLIELVSAIANEDADEDRAA